MDMYNNDDIVILYCKAAYFLNQNGEILGFTAGGDTKYARNVRFNGRVSLILYMLVASLGQ